MTGFAGLQSIKIANTYFQNKTSVVNANFNGVSYVNNDGSYGFINCINLSDSITLPNNVINISHTFENCTSFNTIPTIPDSVSDVSYCFDGCVNISGELYISNPNITNATNCFMNTSNEKVVHIPYYFSNRVYTPTYTAFSSAGYTENSETSKHGVILTDDSTRKTIYNSTVSEFAVHINTYNYPTVNSTHNSDTQIIGQPITYYAYQPGYNTVTGSFVVTENRTIDLPKYGGTLEEVDLSLYNYTIINDVAYVSKYNSTTATVTLPSTTTR